MKIARHKAQKQAFILILASFLVSPLLGMDISADSKKRPLESDTKASAAKKQKTDKEHKEEIDAKTKEKMSKRLFQVIQHWDSLSDAAIDIPIIKGLLDAKADVNLTDDGENTLLHLVIRNKPNHEQPAFIKILLDYGCPVNARNDVGETPLLMLTEDWEQEVYLLDDTREEILNIGKHFASTVKLLMEAGADETIADSAESTPISILRKPCLHSHKKPTCEDCGVHHTCILCGVNQKLLSTIMEHTQYHDKALEQIQKTLEEYHSQKGWQYLAPIIGYYLAGTAQQPTPDPSSHGSGSGSGSGSLSLTMEIDQ